MIDAAKYADLVLLLVDGAFGFEMETFEFLNILQVRRSTANANALPVHCRNAYKPSASTAWSDKMMNHVSCAWLQHEHSIL